MAVVELVMMVVMAVVVLLFFAVEFRSFRSVRVQVPLLVLVFLLMLLLLMLLLMLLLLPLLVLMFLLELINLITLVFLLLNAIKHCVHVCACVHVLNESSAKSVSCPTKKGPRQKGLPALQNDRKAQPKIAAATVVVGGHVLECPKRRSFKRLPPSALISKKVMDTAQCSGKVVPVVVQPLRITNRLAFPCILESHCRDCWDFPLKVMTFI